ncbi:hypothetical protein, partial [Methylobacter sp. BlB1]|uniref:hypothetical protein n=1 Tax=Methylobacter sp. BlB1 TaxID=2785914 RepID=UPI001E459B45
MLFAATARQAKISHYLTDVTTGTFSRLPRRAPQLLAAVGGVDKPSILAAHAGFPLKLQPSLHRLLKA